jgi:hypothetical protein
MSPFTWDDVDFLREDALVLDKAAEMYAEQATLGSHLTIIAEYERRRDLYTSIADKIESFLLPREAVSDTVQPSQEP